MRHITIRSKVVVGTAAGTLFHLELHATEPKERLFKQLYELGAAVDKLQAVHLEVTTHTRSGDGEGGEGGGGGGTAMQKLRIAILGFGTARQKSLLERWTNPKSLCEIVDRAAI